MSSIRLYGDTSGFVQLKAPDVAGDVTITLPNTTGAFATEPYVDAAVAAVPVLAGIGSNVVQTVKADTFSVASSSFTVVTGLEATITPTSDTSKIFVFAMVPLVLDSNVGTHNVQMGVFRSGTNLIVPTSPGSASASVVAINLRGLTAAKDSLFPTPFMFVDSPATDSPVTYDVRVRSDLATLYVNRSENDPSTTTGRPRAIATLILVEVAA
jgi:hypothetical protein